MGTQLQWRVDLFKIKIPSSFDSSRLHYLKLAPFLCAFRPFLPHKLATFLSSDACFVPLLFVNRPDVDLTSRHVHV